MELLVKALAYSGGAMLTTFSSFMAMPALRAIRPSATWAQVPDGVPMALAFFRSR